ncbi:hypothetical protein CIPAW_12G029600 [Carya illinoinensis]|uniref:Uncharacterized protein n=1 Tax=Carya illinoinensis TaxID=32201 RepID=A0A8T1NWJ3_CARIL|nr:hypothetical protein CIPAW_12G029600 [Carya illinoinensis]
MKKMPPVFQTHSTLLTWPNSVRATSRTSHSKLHSPSSARHFVPKGQKDLLQHNPSSCVLRCSLLLTHIDVSTNKTDLIQSESRSGFKFRSPLSISS